MKRSLQQRDFDGVSMANCLLMLSQGASIHPISGNCSSPNRVFECKTCNRTFPSFQALGGHRASHKKPRVEESTDKGSTFKPKTHECSICGLEFAIGQALGGHMRRHRVGAQANHYQGMSLHPDSTKPVPKVGNSDNTKPFFLDLNLTPLENDVKLFKLQNMAHTLDCFL